MVGMYFVIVVVLMYDNCNTLYILYLINSCSKILLFPHELLIWRQDHQVQVLFVINL